jgi:uncharacterized RmlC-like cupin family protein
MRREAAIAPETVGSRGLWAGFVETGPALCSGAHHHGEAESGIYVLKGRVRFYFGEKLEQTIECEPGDFIYVPPLVVHMEENMDADQPAEVIVFRNASEILVINVPDPRE